MFSWLKSRKTKTVPSLTTYEFEYEKQGLVISFSNDFGEVNEKKLLLDNLVEEGFCISDSNSKWIFSWPNLYDLMQLPDFLDIQSYIKFPRVNQVVPILKSTGALSDSDFKISISGWFNKASSSNISVELITDTPILYTDNHQYSLLSEDAWFLLQELFSFYKSTESNTPQYTHKSWAKIRRLAQKCDARLDNFLVNTIVLSPEKLDIKLRKNSINEEVMIEVIPSFEDAPSNWIKVFDDYKDVLTKYDISDGGRLTQIILDDDVKNILKEIKSFPGRRLHSQKARSFLHNPYQALGENAEKIIPVEEFESSRDEAGIFFYRYEFEAIYIDRQKIEFVSLILTEKSLNLREPITFAFFKPNELKDFIDILQNGYARKDRYINFKGYEIQIPDTQKNNIPVLEMIYQNWIEQFDSSFLNIFNLEKYGERVEGIGEAKVISSKNIPSGIEWFGEVEKKWENQAYIINIDELSNEEVCEYWGGNEVFKKAVLQSDLTNQDEVYHPNGDDYISIARAREIVAQIPKQKEILSNEFTLKEKTKKAILQIKFNIDDEKYIKERSEILKLGDFSKPELPRNLKSHIALKDHQIKGIAWLQHLFNYTPSISGCILADDMGLGKTLQLLVFMMQYIENNHNHKPILIIAPVSLLDNWSSEIRKFFSFDEDLVLKLYGEELAHKKVQLSDIPKHIKEAGITNLLQHDWLKNKKIVLTTYETLRDLSFSFGQIDWAIIAFDEAQRIKNPSSLVTQASQAQKADFVVVCTGTPVENSLVDLWCLYDTVQPGLMGSLKDFSKIYRRPIEEKRIGYENLVEQLRLLIDPQLLRRTKLDVAKDLPKKIEDLNCQNIKISSNQEKLYENLLESISHNSSGDKILKKLHEARMICAHPIYLDQHSQDKDSSKLQWLLEQLKKIQLLNQKVVIFTEYRPIQVFLQKVLYERFGLFVSVINGDTKAVGEVGSRQRLIDTFQEKEGFNIIILSTIAVGFGVNIQQANHVIHYTRPWNPAKEDQATDRAYRIGQEKDVYVYYPTVKAKNFATFEEKLDELLKHKRVLATDILQSVDTRSENDIAREMFVSRK